MGVQSKQILKTRLYDEYRIEIPVIDWEQRQFVRVSMQDYNTQDDIDALLAALDALLSQVIVPNQLTT